jgi:hypothetical protein
MESWIATKWIHYTLHGTDSRRLLPRFRLESPPKWPGQGWVPTLVIGNRVVGGAEPKGFVDVFDGTESFQGSKSCLSTRLTSADADDDDKLAILFMILSDELAEP